MGLSQGGTIEGPVERGARSAANPRSIARGTCATPTRPRRAHRGSTPRCPPVRGRRHRSSVRTSILREAEREGPHPSSLCRTESRRADLVHHRRPRLVSQVDADVPGVAPLGLRLRHRAVESCTPPTRRGLTTRRRARPRALVRERGSVGALVGDTPMSSARVVYRRGDALGSRGQARRRHSSALLPIGLVLTLSLVGILYFLVPPLRDVDTLADRMVVALRCAGRGRA